MDVVKQVGEGAGKKDKEIMARLALKISSAVTYQLSLSLGGSGA